MYVWIGTSGYSYEDWVGEFYPEGTRPERMLAYYCQFFPLVELNFTFYRPPSREILLRLAVEFRHRSWARPGLPDWMAGHGLDLVAVDAPDLPGLFPRGWVQSGPRAYVRLHSRSSGNWYLSDKERYDYHYGDDQLGEWVEAAQTHGAVGGTERALFLFNNCHRGQAAE